MKKTGRSSGSRREGPPPEEMIGGIPRSNFDKANSLLTKRFGEDIITLQVLPNGIAGYYCQLCQVEMNGTWEMDQHVKETRHIQLVSRHRPPGDCGGYMPEDTKPNSGPEAVLDMEALSLKKVLEPRKQCQSEGCRETFASADAHIFCPKHDICVQHGAYFAPEECQFCRQWLDVMDSESKDILARVAWGLLGERWDHSKKLYTPIYFKDPALKQKMIRLDFSFTRIVNPAALKLEDSSKNRGSGAWEGSGMSKQNAMENTVGAEPPLPPEPTTMPPPPLPQYPPPLQFSQPPPSSHWSGLKDDARMVSGRESSGRHPTEVYPAPYHTDGALTSTQLTRQSQYTPREPSSNHSPSPAYSTIAVTQLPGPSKTPSKKSLSREDKDMLLNILLEDDGGVDVDMLRNLIDQDESYPNKKRKASDEPVITPGEFKLQPQAQFQSQMQPHLQPQMQPQLQPQFQPPPLLQPAAFPPPWAGAMPGWQPSPGPPIGMYPAVPPLFPVPPPPIVGQGQYHQVAENGRDGSRGKGGRGHITFGF